jgi:hypothetical protein
MSYWFIYYIVDTLSCGQVLQLVPDKLTITEHQSGNYLNKYKLSLLHVTIVLLILISVSFVIIYY